MGVAPSPVTRVMAGRCCQRGRSMRRSSTGLSAVAAATSSLPMSAWRWASPRVTRSKSCPPITVSGDRAPRPARALPATAGGTRGHSCQRRWSRAPSAPACRRRSRRSRYATASPAADAVELTEELFGARISSGTVDAILTRTAQALAEPHDDLLQRCAPRRR